MGDSCLTVFMLDLDQTFRGVDFVMLIAVLIS